MDVSSRELFGPCAGDVPADGHFNTGTFRHVEFLVVFTKKVDVFFGEVSFISQQLYLALVFCQFSEIFVDLLN
jgi:hypothetical protein